MYWYSLQYFLPHLKAVSHSGHVASNGSDLHCWFIYFPTPLNIQYCSDTVKHTVLVQHCRTYSIVLTPLNIQYFYDMATYAIQFNKGSVMDLCVQRIFLADIIKYVPG